MKHKTKGNQVIYYRGYVLNSSRHLLASFTIFHFPMKVQLSQAGMGLNVCIIILLKVKLLMDIIFLLQPQEKKTYILRMAVIFYNMMGKLMLSEFLT